MAYPQEVKETEQNDHETTAISTAMLLHPVQPSIHAPHILEMQENMQYYIIITIIILDASLLSAML